MTENPLIVDVAVEGRATVTLNRPDVHNAFDDKLIALLTRELDALDRNPTVGVVVLAAAGKSFCAGGDLRWMQAQMEAMRAQMQAGQGQGLRYGQGQGHHHHGGLPASLPLATPL